MLERILRERDVVAAIGLSRATLWGRVKSGAFVKPVKISARAVGWPESEIAALNRARIAGKTEKEICALVQQLEASRVAAA